jgi:4-amino-4-deoxy-L-arabinose transferase-like glycosyltransferase
MSASDRARAPARGVASSGAHAEVAWSAPRASGTRAGVARLSGDAWGAIGVTVAFIALTWWWLTQDHGIPIYDAGAHLQTAFEFHDMIRAGDLLGPFTYESPYPPLALVVVALATFVGGINTIAPVLGENVVFASLLALGCYQTGRLLFGTRAGLLAVVFVLGSKLAISQLHVIMLDMPEAAVVAVTMWLLLACEDFRRVGYASLAGVAVGCGLLVKVQYPSFVMGIVLIALLRGGWRQRRGVIAFAALALLVAAPWYLDHLSQFSLFLQNAGSNPATLPTNAPPTFSWANFSWYFWNILNSQLLAFLFAMLLGGTIWMVVDFVRNRRALLHSLRYGGGRAEVDESARAAAAARPAPRVFAGDWVMGARLELFVGAFVAWAFITATPDHDIRYAIPLLPYLAVIGTGWIVNLPRRARLAAAAVVVLGALATTLSTTIGVDGEIELKLGPTESVNLNEALPNRIRFYSSEKFLAAGPENNGNVPALLEELHRDGVRTVTWSIEQSHFDPFFSFEGLQPLAVIAHLTPAVAGKLEFVRSPQIATLVHTAVTPSSPPACARLSDGSGVWVARYDPPARKFALFCPRRTPRYYAVGAVR